MERESEGKTRCISYLTTKTEKQYRLSNNMRLRKESGYERNTNGRKRNAKSERKRRQETSKTEKINESRRVKDNEPTTIRIRRDN